MESLNLEHEGYDDFTYNLDFEFTNLGAGMWLESTLAQNFSFQMSRM